MLVEPGCVERAFSYNYGLGYDDDIQLDVFTVLILIFKSQQLSKSICRTHLR